MTKLLYWGDYTTPTGFSQVASNILKRLPTESVLFDEDGDEHYSSGFEIDVVGIGYFGEPDYDRNRFPGRVWPAIIPGKSDLFGRPRLLERIVNGRYDTVFLFQDLPVLDSVYDSLVELKKERNFQLVIYFPVDAYVRKEWLRIIELADFALTYTKESRNLINTLDKPFPNFGYVYHGVDTWDFRPFSIRRDITKFKLLNINRNQPRKDLVRSLVVLAELKKRGFEEFYLYFHASPHDIGGDIRISAKELGLVQGVDWDIDEDLTPKGISFEELNALYNNFDALITTSMGEGWGLSVAQAMATKLPVVAPDLPVFGELLGEDRGFLAKTGSSPSLWTVLENDNQLLRPLVDVEDMADEIIKLRNLSLADRVGMVERAYKFAMEEFNWKKIVDDQWVPILEV
jgi:glycosyltransferase involved in cell wall biosynthesis